MIRMRFKSSKLGIPSQALVLFLLLVIIACRNPSTDPSNKVQKESPAFISLHEFQKENKVGGLAFSLFDGEGVIQEVSLGKSSYGTSIDNESLFSIQSISKNVSALAVMMAVEDGLVELDSPIINYLRDFTVNSCFEDSPEEKITLRMMLSHTAGFTHEAPVGNNFDYRKHILQDHLNSIQDTWLKFPPGEGYAYSNLGFDLSTEILANQSGIPFEQYLDQKIFNPLGMENTTINDDEIVSNPNKTEGFISYVKSKHYSIPLIGSGAVYTNIKDFAKYGQFMINLGQWKGEQLIDPDLLLEMFRINRNNYGLGTYISRTNGRLFINHNGGGYGYTSTYIIYPEYKIGAVLFCNRPVNTFSICEKLVNEFIDENNLEIDPEIERAYNQVKDLLDKAANGPGQLRSCPADSVFQLDPKEYVGNYALIYKGFDPKWYTQLAFNLGFRPQKIRIFLEEGELRYKGVLGEGRLHPYIDGLFFTDEGEAVDFRGKIPTFRNILLEAR